MTFTKTLVIIGLVLLAHAAGIFFDLYALWGWYDIPMHFGGGFAAGALGLAIWQEGIEEVKFKGWFAKHLKWWLIPLFVMGVVAIISVAWEFHEWALDELVGGSRQPGLTDTMFDFVFDTAGGIVALLIFHYAPSLWRSHR